MISDLLSKDHALLSPRIIGFARDEKGVVWFGASISGRSKDIQCKTREERWIDLEQIQQLWDHKTGSAKEKKCILAKSSVFKQGRLKSTMQSLIVDYNEQITFSIYPFCHLCSMQYSDGNTTYTYNQKHSAANCAKVVPARIINGPLPLAVLIVEWLGKYGERPSPGEITKSWASIVACLSSYRESQRDLVLQVTAWLGHISDITHRCTTLMSSVMFVVNTWIAY